MTFFTVLTSVLLQGTSLPLVAKWLGVNAPLRETFHYSLAFVTTSGMNGELAAAPARADQRPAVICMGTSGPQPA